MGPNTGLERRGFYIEARLSWKCPPGEILNLPQLLAGNLWLDLSVSVESEPKSLWFSGVTAALCSRKAK